MSIANGFAPGGRGLLDGLNPVPEERLADTRRLTLVNSADFAGADETLEWLVRGLLVRGQPAVVGGPRKSLKTSVLIDLAVSLGAGAGGRPDRGPLGARRRPGPDRKPADGGVRFLNHFVVPRPVRAGLFSGESGRATVQETARRVCESKGVSLERNGTFWGFDLPRLSDRDDLTRLQALIRDNGLGVVVIDPLYLSLLAGNAGASASNLYDIGPLLADVSRACLEAGATPVLAHHARKNRDSRERYEPLELEDLAYAGVQEFARQWVLLGRRERYDPDSGLHRLWLNAGGSAGFSGVWAVDVDEGLVREDFGGRRWVVTTRRAAEARRAAAAAKEGEREQARQAHRAAEGARIREAIRAHLGRDRHRAGDSLTALAQAAGKSRAADVRPFVESMLDDGELVEALALVKGRKTCDGYRLAGGPAGVA